jgi:hypothetical protein
MAGQCDHLTSDVVKFIQQVDALLDVLEVDNLTNARRKAVALQAELASMKEQMQGICDTLEVDNWWNAQQRARALLAKDTNLVTAP